MDVTTYKAQEGSPAKDYTISDLSSSRPSSISEERLDVRFVASASDRAADFLWLTLSSAEGDDVVLLVDGKGLQGQGINREAAKGMRMNVHLVWVGEGVERTALAEVLEGIVPRF